MGIKELVPAVFVLFLATSALTTACGGNRPSVAPVTVTQAHAHSHDPHDHNHARGKMLMASDGKTNALLTSHLSSKTGNELDIFVEHAGAPLAIKTTRIEAKAKDDAGTSHALTFDCAPRDERPAGEPDGVCSHFVAKAAWMAPGQALRVESGLPLESGEGTFVWRDFEPKRYAHHEE